jgi:hypothetical protein
VEKDLSDLLDSRAGDATTLLNGERVCCGLQLDARRFSDRAGVEIGLQFDRGR